jgi:hypothetical protein
MGPAPRLRPGLIDSKLLSVDIMSTLLAIILLQWMDKPKDTPSVLVVVGAPGTDEYRTEFRRWASLWRTAAERTSAQFLEIGEEPQTAPPDRERLRKALAARASTSIEPLWLVLIGHGTFDGHEAKFNLRGPDVTDLELLEWIKPIQRPVAILNCFSASGPFLSRLSASNRVIVTATRSGDEQNFTRFGQYLAESIADPRGDLDKDGQVSLLEAFLVASNRVAEFYRTRSRLATEHPLIDDNGDRLGTPADWFRGIHATKRARDGAELDGARAHQFHLILSDREQRMSREQRQQRDRLERSAADLRSKKDHIAEDEYYAQLERIMIDLARLYHESASP